MAAANPIITRKSSDPPIDIHEYPLHPCLIPTAAAEAERVGFRSKALDLFACEGNGGAPHVTGGGLTITGSGHGVAGSAPPLDRRTSSPGMEGGPSPPTATPSATAEFTPLAAHPEVTAGAPGQPGHGGAPQLPSPHDEPINMRAFRYLYERVNDANAEAFLADFAPRLTATRDMVIIHDPQVRATIDGGSSTDVTGGVSPW